MSPQYLKPCLTAIIVFAVTFFYVSSTNVTDYFLEQFEQDFAEQGVISISEKLLEDHWKTKGDIWCKKAYESEDASSLGLRNATQILGLDGLELKSLKCILGKPALSVHVIPLKKKLHILVLIKDRTQEKLQPIGIVTVNETVAKAQFIEESDERFCGRLFHSNSENTDNN